MQIRFDFRIGLYHALFFAEIERKRLAVTRRRAETRRRATYGRVYELVICIARASYVFPTDGWWKLTQRFSDSRQKKKKNLREKMIKEELTKSINKILLHSGPYSDFLLFGALFLDIEFLDSKKERKNRTNHQGQKRKTLIEQTRQQFQPYLSTNQKTHFHFFLQNFLGGLTHPPVSRLNIQLCLSLSLLPP